MNLKKKSRIADERETKITINETFQKTLLTENHKKVKIPGLQ